jgi:hypothetical protein
MGILESKKLTPKTLHLDAEDKASGTIDSIEKKLQGIKDKTVKLMIDATGGSMKINADGSFTTSAGGHGAAAGTTVTGGIPGVDSVPMLLMPGEEVIKTSEANKHRGLLKDINAGRMANGGTVGGDVHIKASGRGNADPAFASVASYMAHAAASAASLNAAAAKAAAAIPHANSGGTEQWRALFNFVARAKGEPLASVQVGLNQMSRESGGNPAAINLTDINAQQGHPSKGLMQFIDGTFRRFADPGYGSNIWDPQSQFRAWYNYIDADYGGFAQFAGRGYGPYAAGGTIRGGVPGRDSVPSLLMPGEEVIKTSAANKHRPLLKAINAGRMASGGTVGLVSAAQLGGAPDPTYGDRTGRIVQALSSIADSINAANGKAVDDASKRHDAQVQYNQDHDTQIRADRAYEKSKTAANLQAKKVADAQAALSLKTLSNTRVAAMVSAHNAAAVASQQRACRASTVRCRALGHATTRSPAGSARHGTPCRAPCPARRRPSPDTHLPSPGSTVGSPGHSDVRGTAAAVINGQRFDLGKIKAFQGDIAKLKREGLSADILSQLTSQFGSGGEITAHALASGSLAQVRAANSLQAQITSAATATGTTVAGSQYDSLIKAQSVQVSTLAHQQAILNNQISYLARTIDGKLVHALSGLKIVQDPQGAWKIVQQGQKLAAGR